MKFRYHKFYFLPTNLLAYLFKAYCTSFYGLNLWFEETPKVRDMKKLEIAYHKAIKRVANMHVWQSNHEACEVVGTNIFKHMMSKRFINYYYTVINSKCRMIGKFKYFLMLNSQLYKSVKNRMHRMYAVSPMLNNDKSALISRIYFVERNEPRSNYVYESQPTQ